MSSISLDNNLAFLDRVLRGGLGFSLMVKAVRKPGPLSPWMMLSGVLLTIPSLTGTDPVLKFFGLSTHPSDENFILNMAKQALPGQGIKPSLTQYACPSRPLKHVFPEAGTLQQALVVS